MRIAFIVHTYFPHWQAGTEVYARSLARKAVANGHDAFIICYEPPDKDAEGFAGLNTWDTVFDGIPVHRISFFKTYRMFHMQEYFHPAVERHLLDYLAAIRPDIVHLVHCMHLSTAAIWAAKRLGMPVVATATDFWYVCPTYQLVKYDESLCRSPGTVPCLACVSSAPRGSLLDQIAKRAWLSKLLSPLLLLLAQSRLLKPDLAEILIWLSARPGWMRQAMSHVDVLLAPTPNTANLLRENGVTAIEVRTCGFGLDLRPVAQARKPESRLRLAYVGTFRESKGVHVLLEAVRQLPADRFSLDIYGKPGHFPVYDRRLFELAKGLSNVTFCGTFPNEELPAVFATFDVLVIPALWYENSPLVLLSAFSQKVPVVASRVGSLADLVQHEKNGLLFRMGDPSSLATQLRRILDDPELVSRLRKGIPEVKTVDENVSELLAIYEELHSRYKTNRPVAPKKPHMSPALARAFGLLSRSIRLTAFGAQFENQVALLHFRAALTDDHKLHFSFRWHAPEIHPEWMVFLHLVDSTGKIWAQGDHPLCRYRQDPWGFITYSIEIPAPPSAEEIPSYSVQFGIWNPQTAERLAVVYARGLKAGPEPAILSAVVPSANSRQPR